MTLHYIIILLESAVNRILIHKALKHLFWLLHNGLLNRGCAKNEVFFHSSVKHGSPPLNKAIGMCTTHGFGVQSAGLCQYTCQFIHV